MNKLLSYLLENGIYLSKAGDKLSIEFDGDSIPDELLEEIKKNKAELLDYLSRVENSATYSDIVPAKPSVAYDLSSAQKRLWILNQLDENSLAYNIPVNMFLNQDIDVEFFKKAVDATVERHEILRTVFREDATGEVKQWVLSSKEIGFEIEVLDFRDSPDTEREVQAYIQKDSQLTFDLAKGPLLRAALIQVADDKHLFYFNMHHIISDEWSMDILSKDVFAFYEAFSKNKEAEIQDLRIQYKDYSAWQLTQLENETFKAHKDYWTNLLSGDIPRLDLPSSKQRSKVITHNGHSLLAYIDAETTAQLKKYCQENGGSVFMGLLAVWNVLMYTYTSKKDIVVGTPVTGREHPDLENQIGFYVNTLALRNEINPQESFNEFYQRVKNSTLEGYDHQMYPFDRLIEDLEVRRDASRSPIFDVLLDYHKANQNTEEADAGVPSDAIQDLGNIHSKFDVEIHYAEMGDRISILAHFNEDLYEKETIETLIYHYRSLAKQLLLQPDAVIDSVQLLSEDEQHRLLVEFNDTEVSYPKATSLLSLIDDHFTNSPDKLAIRGDNESFTYAELDELSNQLAWSLKENYGLKPGDFAGIKLDRSEWAIISMLAVLKTGAAYVPIDPNYPLARKAHILSESTIQLLITNTDYLFDEEQFEGAVFAVDVEFERDQYSKDRINEVESADSLAYVIYTSGSTGKPKGVMINHHSLLNYLRWAQSYYSNNGAINLDFGLFTSTSFDLTITSLYLPLISGGTVHVFKAATEVAGLLKDYFQSDLSCIKLTPAHVSLLGNMDIAQSSVSVAIVGGDHLNSSHIKILRSLNPQMRIYNEYGPTEATVGCIVSEIKSEDEAILIGKPIANTRVYLLNDEQNLQPIGVIGEICISGDGLSQGYLNQATLTEQKFVSNPFKDGELMYKTGDLGRWLPEGSIEFLGRKDDQVKIRGYRIELAEIEHALLQLESINTTVVLAKEDEQSEKVLVAYITAKGGQNSSDLRSHLEEILPEYMIPTHFVQLEGMPLTTNGKIDKKSLPNPKGLGVATGTEYVAPRNETEERLVKIWKEALQREKIGVEDDFFALGGQSISAMKVISIILKEFDYKLNVTELFDNPTVAKLASFIGTLSLVQNQSAIASDDDDDELVF